jgi:uncharacterized membrane-anchored protein YitT (DUF2179 family)
MRLMHFNRLIVVCFGSLLSAVAINFFLIPANVYSSGFTGASQLISRFLSEHTNINLSTGVLLFLLNIPVTILGWFKVGKAFTIYGFISIFLTSFFLELIPIQQVSQDILLNAVFGGVISAVGIGFTLRWGASTGGMDIIAMILSRMKDKPIGIYILTLNSIIILSAGFLFGWEKALYTLVTLYTSTRVIDAIHTRHVKLTAFIITRKADELKKAIHSKLIRGSTAIPARGGYTDETKDLLMIVLTRYELFDLERIIKEVDPKAFTNIIQTTRIFGFFRKE